MENARKISKHIQRILGKHLSVLFMENIANWDVRIRGKYLNIFGEYAERIYAYMEKTQRDSWRILLIAKRRKSVYISVIFFNNKTNFNFFIYSFYLHYMGWIKTKNHLTLLSLRTTSRRSISCSNFKSLKK